MAADPQGDFIELTLPMSLSVGQRQRMIQAHSRLLGILNGPASKTAKESARKGMRELRKQIAGLGGRVDMQMSNYQTDPTTGEITGTIGGGPAAPAKARAVESAKGHQVRVPLVLTKPPAAPAPGAPTAPTGVMAPLTREQALAGRSGPTTQQILQVGATAPPVPQAIVTDPARFAAQPVPAQVSTAIPDLSAPQAAAAPQAPAAAPAPAAATTAAKPTVPPISEDLNADPLLGALPPATEPAPAQQPAAAAETPEMTMLRRLIAEPEPPPPDLGISTAQKAAFGFLVGLKPEAAAGIGEIISGQRAEAAQRYVLSRQNREALINNLTRLVQLQGVEAERAANLQTKRADLVREAQGSATALNALHAQAAPTLGAAMSLIDALARNPDPALQARAVTLASQMTAVKDTQTAIQAGFDRDPLSVKQPQIDLFDQSIKGLHATVNDAITEMAKQVEQTKLPDSTTQQIASLHNSSAALRQAIAMVKEGVGGPVSGRMLHTTVGALLAPGAAEQVGVLDSLIEQASAERARGITGRLAEFETEVFPSVFLSSTLTLEQFIGRANGMIAYSEAKARMLGGAPGAQTEAERYLAEAAGWVVVGHTAEDYPIWQSPAGIQYKEQPEAP